MGWSDCWPPVEGGALTAAPIFEELRAALAERDALVPAGYVPGPFARWDPVRGTPAGASPVEPTVANFQYEIAEMLALAWPLRWWDMGRDALYTLADLCQDAFGQPGWTWDLVATDGQGLPLVHRPPAAAAIFEELYATVNRLDSLRILPTAAETVRSDSVARVTWGIGDWPAERVATFAMFDGTDDGADSELTFDVGLGGRLWDDIWMQDWSLESRQHRMLFATEAFAGCEIAGAWLDFCAEAPGGSVDFEGAFAAEVVDGAGNQLATFASDDVGSKRVTVPATSIDAGGQTEFWIRSQRPDTDDRPGWSPAGTDYTSTYREGFAVAGPVRLIVEVAFDFRG